MLLDALGECYDRRHLICYIGIWLLEPSQVTRIPECTVDRVHVRRSTTFFEGKLSPWGFMASLDLTST
jgi:hypothetical protein